MAAETMEDRKETMEDRKETLEDRKDSVEAEIDQAAEILGSRLMDSLQEYKQTPRLTNFILRSNSRTTF
jgi:hypothetical protein